MSCFPEKNPIIVPYKMPCFRPAIFLVAFFWGGPWRMIPVDVYKWCSDHPHWFQPFSWQRKWSLNNLILRGTYKATMVNGRLNRPGSPSSKWLLIEATATEQAVATLVADHKEVGGFWRRVLDWCFLVVRFVCICQIFGVNHMIAVILVSLYHNKVGFVGVCFCRAIAVCTIVFFPMKRITPKHPKKQFGLMHCYCEYLHSTLGI